MTNNDFNNLQFELWSALRAMETFGELLYRADLDDSIFLGEEGTDFRLGLKNIIGLITKQIESITDKYEEELRGGKVQS